MKIRTIKGTFAYMAKLWSFKPKSKSNYYEIGANIEDCVCTGLCSTLFYLSSYDIISYELYNKVKAVIDKFYKVFSVYFWDINEEGAKQRAAFCRFMSKQRFPLSKKVIEKAALKFNLGVR